MSRGGVAALNDISLEVAPGEFVSIIGPSGCGKSILLRSIAGLEKVDAGQILIGGRNVGGLKASAREVAFVFQSYALYPHMTCRENLAAPLTMQLLSAFGRMPLLHRLSPAACRARAAIARRVARIAAQLQIQNDLDRRPAALSGGQRQRVALGRALIRRNKLFLLDEPLANLDAALRNTTRAELHALQRRVGATTLFVIHGDVAG
jgi:multiple sugar transport system ATP-binding protein